MSAAKLQFISSAANGLISLALLLRAEYVDLRWYAWASIGYIIFAPATRAWVAESCVYTGVEVGISAKQRLILGIATVGAVVVAVAASSPWPVWLLASIGSETTRLSRRGKLSAIPECLSLIISLGLLLEVVVLRQADIWKTAGVPGYALVAAVAVASSHRLLVPVPLRTRSSLAFDSLLATGSTSVSTILTATVAGPVAVGAIRVAASLMAPVTSLSTVLLVRGLAARELRGVGWKSLTIVAAGAVIAAGLILSAETGLLSPFFRPYVALMLLVVASAVALTSGALVTAAAKLAGHWNRLLAGRLLLTALAVPSMILVAALGGGAMAIVSVDALANAAIVFFGLRLIRRKL